MRSGRHRLPHGPFPALHQLGGALARQRRHEGAFDAPLRTQLGQPAIRATGQPGQVGRAQIAEMAKALGMGAPFLYKTAAELARKLPAAVQAACDEVMPHLKPSGRVFVGKLLLWVISTTEKTARRIAGLPDADQTL